MYQNPRYDNDILGMSVIVFNRLRDERAEEHFEILESALGIGKKLGHISYKDGQDLMTQFCSVLRSMNNPGYNQPPDAGQFLLMMFSDDFAYDVREYIAQNAFGLSLDVYQQTMLTKIPALKNLIEVTTC